ncbi:MAG TPA: ribosome biogenesis GTPase Der [Oligoflexia bacterium]|nr:ribosome biogenesis GTPase Der [Oligoflexia bacterium]HMP27703.1 ribosome biogenesis GTPase Der [Oligoflexia bacterium]
MAQKRENPIVAIVGRTNVGKSSLLNALAAKRIAVVDKTAGTTRDRVYAEIEGEKINYTLIDCGGLFGDEEGGLASEIKAQVELAVDEADLLLGVFDGKNGVHPNDADLVKFLKRAKKQTLWVVNKCEKNVDRLAAGEFYALGIDNLQTISAAHRVGIKELRGLIEGKLFSLPQVKAELKKEEKIEVDSGNDSNQSKDGEVDIDSELAKGIRVAFLGRPNVGKSTMINSLLKTKRVIASQRPGTTTDTIEALLYIEDQKYILVDTAGLRKKAKVARVSLERYANLRSLIALARADVVVLLLDATAGNPSDQDLKLAELVNARGTPLIIAVNKWDALEKDNKTAGYYKTLLKHLFNFVDYAPIIFTSALTGKNAKKIMLTAKQLFIAARRKIKTVDLNKKLEALVKKQTPPIYRGEPIRLSYITQIGIAPPSFLVFVNHPAKIPASYVRYLKNGLRELEPFEGSDLKVKFRKK